MIRVALPYHLRQIAGIDGEIRLSVSEPVTQRAVLDALETKFPELRGTIRDRTTKRRRPFIRFFACRRDFSLESPDALLPDAVAKGAESFLIVAAIAGG